MEINRCLWFIYNRFGTLVLYQFEVQRKRLSIVDVSSCRWKADMIQVSENGSTTQFRWRQAYLTEPGYKLKEQTILVFVTVRTYQLLSRNHLTSLLASCFRTTAYSSFLYSQRIRLNWLSMDVREIMKTIFHQNVSTEKYTKYGNFYRPWMWWR